MLESKSESVLIPKEESAEQLKLLTCDMRNIHATVLTYKKDIDSINTNKKLSIYETDTSNKLVIIYNDCISSNRSLLDKLDTVNDTVFEFKEYIQLMVEIEDRITISRKLIDSTKDKIKNLEKGKSK